MLAVKLNTPKNIDLSRSSFNDEEPDVKSTHYSMPRNDRSYWGTKKNYQKVEHKDSKSGRNFKKGTCTKKLWDRCKVGY